MMIKAFIIRIYERLLLYAKFEYKPDVKVHELPQSLPASFVMVNIADYRRSNTFRETL